MKLSGIANWRQPLEGDCLPSCVAMVLTYLGERVNYQRLRKRLGTTEGGTYFSNLDRVRSWRWDVVRARGTLAILQQYIQAEQPIIVGVSAELLPYWLTRTDLDVMQRHIEHAVVVVGIENNFIFLNDPDFEDAPQAIDMDWFDEAWRGQNYQYMVIRRRWSWWPW